jgi:hypothetical protein
MKHMKTSAALAISLALLSIQALSQAATSPGKVDFGEFDPPASGGEYVEINIGPTLINLASQLVAKHEPEAAKMLNELRGIKVNVVAIDDDNREALHERARKVRESLDSKGWEKVVTVKKQEQDVGIYMKSQDKQVVQGLALVVFEGNKQAVFINVDGNIRPEQLSMLGERLHMEELKKAGELSAPKRHARARKSK